MGGEGVFAGMRSKGAAHCPPHWFKIQILPSPPPEAQHQVQVAACPVDEEGVQAHLGYGQARSLSSTAVQWHGSVQPYTLRPGLSYSPKTAPPTSMIGRIAALMTSMSSLGQYKP